MDPVTEDDKLAGTSPFNELRCYPARWLRMRSIEGRYQDICPEPPLRELGGSLKGSQKPRRCGLSKILQTSRDPQNLPDSFTTQILPETQVPR